MMNERYILEKKGEKAAIYLKLFLIGVFSLGTVIGILVQNEVPQILGNFVTGILVYSLSALISIYTITREKYNAALKYYGVILELIGFAIVVSGYLRFDTKEDIGRGVRSITLFGVYFLLIAGSSLRFSPRFALTTGILTTSLFIGLALFFKQITQNAPPPGINIDIAFIIVNSLFLMAMAVTTTTCTKYVRQLVEEQIESKNQAKEKSESLSTMVAETKYAIKELNSVFQSMNEVVASNQELNHDQSQLMDEISSIINLSSETTNKIQKLTSTQENIFNQNSSTMKDLNDAMLDADRVNKIIHTKGKDALKRAELGEKELNNTVEEMENIKSISIKVSHIVSIIYGIAKQTNLLALNAAIEAARAGEQGKGFAVVADEVSKLAALAGRNATQIGELVKEMNQATQTGATKIQTVVNSIRDIVQGIRLIVSELTDMDEKVKKEMTLIKEVLDQNSEMQSVSNSLKSTSGEQTKFSSEILENIQMIHKQSNEILKTAGVLQENTILLHNITERLNSHVT